MPSPQDLIYKQAFDQCIKAGLPARESEEAGVQAVRAWRRNTKASDAIAEAVRLAKKSKSRVTV